MRGPTREALLKDPTIPWQPVQAHAAGQTYEVKIKTRGPVSTAMDQGQQALRLVVAEPVPYRASQRSQLERREPAYLICTDSELPLQELLQTFLWRWGIKVNFRDENPSWAWGRPRSARRLPTSLRPRWRWRLTPCCCWPPSCF